MKTYIGFTLIEVLIALLVLALGLMGLAALQTYSLRANLAAYTRGQATQLLYDMSDRMRTNSTSAKTGSYKIANTTTNQKIDANHPCRLNTNTTCNAAKLAEYDLIEWHNAIAATLPMGKACIDYTNSIYTLYITWDDNRSGVIYSDRQDLGTYCKDIASTSSAISENDTKNPDPVLSMSVQL